MRCVEITGSDDRMDCKDMFYAPINPLPKKCSSCGFPNLDFIPQPYFLVKSRTMSPNEVALAAYGNFLVRDRVKQILETVAPKQCAFYPTHFQKSDQTTPWFLVVPRHQVETAKVNASIPRCKKCKEPRSAHPGSQYSKELFITPSEAAWLGCETTSLSKYEIVKFSTWASSEMDWNVWLDRRFFLSVRLMQLFKQLKVKGFYEAGNAKGTLPSKEETSWIANKLEQLRSQMVQLHQDGTVSDEVADWFGRFLKANRKKKAHTIDSTTAEKRLKCKLPHSYREFINKIGAHTFRNVDQQGFDVKILSPKQLVVVDHEETEDEESKAVNGLMFATTDHGDFYCFDMQKGLKELPVFLYKHEMFCYEPYAENFAACIKRFSGG